MQEKARLNENQKAGMYSYSACFKFASAGNVYTVYLFYSRLMSP